MHESEDDADDSDADGNEEGEGNGEGDDEKKSKGKKKTGGEGGSWWPREAFVIKKETELELLVDKDCTGLQEQYNLLLKETQALLALQFIVSECTTLCLHMCFGRAVCYAQAIARMPVRAKAFFSKDMTLARTVLSCCKVVFGRQ